MTEPLCERGVREPERAITLPLEWVENLLGWAMGHPIASHIDGDLITAVQREVDQVRREEDDLLYLQSYGTEGRQDTDYRAVFEAQMKRGRRWSI